MNDMTQIQTSNLDWGLTLENLEQRQGSIGASDARIIVNGKDEAIEALWLLKRGELQIVGLDNKLAIAQGQYIEGFHRLWFERRTGIEVERAGEFMTCPELPGYHCTLDGWITLPNAEFSNPEGDFAYDWGCAKPANPVFAVWEAKWKTPFGFKIEGAVAEYAPQLHQQMAITGLNYAVLSCLTGAPTMTGRVVEFDPFYWAECQTRIEDFREAVETGRPPRKFPALKAEKGAERVKTVMRTMDMSEGPKANLWGAYAGQIIATLPSDEEKQREKDHEKAKKELKALIPADCGVATGNGITFTRDAGNKLRMTVDPQEVERIQKDNQARKEAGL